MKNLARLASWLFGLALVGLSAFVALETIMRKSFNYSFGGADELGGYVLAIGSALAFTVALIDRAHVRVDFFHAKLGLKGRAVLDWLAIASLALTGVFLVYIGYFVVSDTINYGSVAPTPWVTPLIYPQSLWYGGFCLFAVAATVMAVRATYLLFTGRLATLSSEFNPKGIDEELAVEMQDAHSR